MKYSLKCLVFLILLGVTKAHGRFITMAILGLAGLWMVHLLAQDYSKITKPKSFASALTKIISKRSIRQSKYDNVWQLRWDDALHNDPLDCIKSFVCQTAAQENELIKEEKTVLEFVRIMSERQTDLNQIKESIVKGEVYKNSTYCQDIYHKCPYSVITMNVLMKSFGG